MLRHRPWTFDFPSAFYRSIGAFLAFLISLSVASNCLAEDSANGTPDANLEADYNPTNGLGSWIWAAKTLDRQTCQFWRAFEIPAGATVSHARLAMTVDNEFTLYLDGRELGRGAEWRELFDYDVSHLLTPGRHVLAVKAYNASSFAGMILGLRIELMDGTMLGVKSDSAWRIVPEGARHWEKRLTAPADWPAATVMAEFQGEPWQEMPVRINWMPTLEPIKTYFWQTGWFQILLLSVSGIVILVSLRLLAQLALHRKEQWLLQQERARIARDIHDDLGSRMTQLVLHGEVAQSELPSDSETRLQIDRICEEARGILSTMDEILWAVNPKRDAFRDFTSFICGYAQEFFKPTRIQCLFDVAPSPSLVTLNLPLKRALLMVIKETFNNIVKHSGATEVLLQVKWHARTLLVVVSDNGKGFDQTRLPTSRNGLLNMSQRMKELGGNFELSSQPGKGCRTELSLPLKQPSSWSLHKWSWKLKPSVPPARNEASAADILHIHDHAKF